jgi:vibriolysin
MTAMNIAKTLMCLAAYLLPPSLASAAEPLDLSTIANTTAKLNSNLPQPRSVADTPSLASALRATFGLSATEDFALNRTSKNEANDTFLHYDQTVGGVPVWGEKVIIKQSNGGEIRNASGTVYKGLLTDLGSVTPKISANAALDVAQHSLKSRADLNADDLKVERKSSRLVVYVRPTDQKALLAYEVDLLAVDEKASRVTRPAFIIDANSGTVLLQYENFQSGQGTGPGGNLKTGEYFFGPGKRYPEFDITALGGNQCSMDSTNVYTFNMNEGSTEPGSPFTYACFDNTTKQINGAYAPMNDAQYFGNIVFAMYGSWYGTRPITQKLKMRVHYLNQFENAGWDGSEMNYGDGATRFYPLVSLDVTGHEVSHGYTEQHSGLIYQHQSGGMNEAFSDMAGMASVFYANGTPTSSDYRIGESIFKATGAALRYMCNPTADGGSIDSAKNYSDSLDVHYTSGVYNKAFCVLSKRAGWDIRKTFEVFLIANRDYWKPSATFVDGAQGVFNAAKDKGYNTDDVVTAFAAVDIIIPLGQPAGYIYDTLRVIANGNPRGCNVNDYNCMTNICKGDLGASAWRGWGGCYAKGSVFLCNFECSIVKQTTTPLAHSSALGLQ